ncbi:MAG TPA: hypothetical protein VME44_15720 [Streptosporangiaceae bacterium]|nr:hypothetical protein [Streptosporangiaceae bacterium]
MALQPAVPATRAGSRHDLSQRLARRAPWNSQPASQQQQGLYLLAGGAVVIDAWLQDRPGRLRNLLLARALTTAVAVPLVLPVLPAADIGWTYKINPTLGETVGWPQFARTVDGVWKSLPARQRASAPAR